MTSGDAIFFAGVRVATGIPRNSLGEIAVIFVMLLLVYVVMSCHGMACGVIDVMSCA